MRKVNRTIAATIIAAGIVGGTYAFLGSPLVPVVSASWKEHPQLEKANGEIRGAIDALKEAPHDFHGHRADAIKELERAQHQLRICAEEKDKAAPDLSPLEHHPRLESARLAIIDAREYLEKAPHDFHGHKKEAIEDLNSAIHQLELCLKE